MKAFSFICALFIGSSAFANPYPYPNPGTMSLDDVLAKQSVVTISPVRLNGKMVREEGNADLICAAAGYTTVRQVLANKMLANGFEDFCRIHKQYGIYCEKLPKNLQVSVLHSVVCAR